MANENPSFNEDSQFLKYDRQIRIWGIEAQRKISFTRVLLIGALSPTGNEVAKNLILTGISHLYILREDDMPSDSHKVSSFFLHSMPENDFIDKYDYLIRQIQPLNPSVSISAISEHEEAVGAVDCIIHCNKITSNAAKIPTFDFSQVLSSLHLQIGVQMEPIFPIKIELCLFPFKRFGIHRIHIFRCWRSIQVSSNLNLSTRYGSDQESMPYNPIDKVTPSPTLDAIRREKLLKFSNDALSAAVASVIGGAGTQDILRVISKNGISTPGLYIFDGEDFSNKLIN
ncbi:hypothetical protein DI09_118p40 [Mitosporidium daphniae]|uniref:THIF-type NAD/FAD binding fold domain-containing protein n=1 Tax=Mitosporidium daphniae TaxID=1485682 RepID=A0A098VVX1_9MICR|nr:uncharacterized protein DI09_118p40 [Mitosporidium daphniae]KGG53009.1 hypothetical protein DI09_118p40 [Mitosporidium daphniae]|eukprot:XP_013239445.1 uncharacterized protein DI09_118p40 [Mitosporidium daphniae]